MRQPYIAVSALAALLMAGEACSPGGSPPVTVPGPTTPTDVTPQPRTAYLQFKPGTYRYQFTQTANITGSGVGDTLPSTVMTRALIYVTVASGPDSAFAVTVSFDSIAISTQGSIPPRGMNQATMLDSIVRGVFSRTTASSDIHLPDSLCGYGHLGSIGRELLFPELSFEVEAPTRRTFTDNITQESCRAGITIGVTTTRELKNAGRTTGEMTIEQKSTIQGAGALRRDSLTISGSISTHGVASFATLNRLPTLIRTTSEGKITVQLGNTSTDFRQHSTEEIQLIMAEPQ
jgi:hypothetical protein